VEPFPRHRPAEVRDRHPQGGGPPAPLLGVAELCAHDELRGHGTGTCGCFRFSSASVSFSYASVPTTCEHQQTTRTAGPGQRLRHWRSQTAIDGSFKMSQRIGFGRRRKGRCQATCTASRSARRGGPSKSTDEGDEATNHGMKQSMSASCRDSVDSRPVMADDGCAKALAAEVDPVFSPDPRSGRVLRVTPG